MQSRRKRDGNDAIMKWQVQENWSFLWLQSIFWDKLKQEKRYKTKNNSAALQLCQPCDPYLQQVQQGSANDSQVSSLQGLGVVHSRKLKQEKVDNITAKICSHNKCLSDK